MGLRAVCSSGDSDGQAAFFVALPRMAGILSKGSPEMGAGNAGDLGGLLSMHSCSRLGSIFLFFLASGSRSRVWHLIALLFLVPPAAKEGKGDCEFPLCPPWILLLPLCNAGHCVPRGGYGRGLLSIELSISGGRFYDTWLIWERCSLAQTMLLLWRGADARYLIVNVG